MSTLILGLNRMNKFISITSRTSDFTGISNISHEIERPFWRLGQKYAEFPFGFSISFDSCKKETKTVSEYKIKSDVCYKNGMVALVSLVVFEEDITNKIYEGPFVEHDISILEEHMINSRKLLGKKFIILLREMLHKNIKKFPVLKAIAPAFMKDVECCLYAIGWLGTGPIEPKPILIDDDVYYYDDIDGVSRETSHPNFINCFCEDFYYDNSDEESPFGNDIGNDTLRALECYIKDNGVNYIDDFPKELMESWGYKYIEPVNKKQETFVDLMNEMSGGFFEYCEIYHRVVYATALGQIKITGKINCDIKEKAEAAFHTLLRVYVYKDRLNAELTGKKWVRNMNRIENSEYPRICYEDLNGFNLYCN